jgi:hypothetical protein
MPGLNPAGKIQGDHMPTRKYLCIQRSVPGNRAQPSPAQMQEMYATFEAWKEKFKDRIVDMGSPLKPGGRVITATTTTDGPFVEAKEVIGGYMIVSADSWEAALEVARESPGVMSPGSSIEIRELAVP